MRRFASALRWLRARSEPWHPADEDIVLFLDGELPDRQSVRVRDHLEACWACRARAQRVQEAITDFAEFVIGPLAGRIPAPPSGWSTFAAALRLETASRPADVHASTLGLRYEHRSRVVSVRALAAIIAAAAIAGALVVGVNFWTPPVSAAQVLEQSRAADARFVDSDLVLHRVMRLNARRLPDGRMQSRGHVEVWRSGGRGVTTRRYFDAQGRLVAGEWRLDSGSRTVYRAGEPPQVGANPQLSASYVWLWDATADDFLRLVGRADRARITHDRARYHITYTRPDDDRADALVSAHLTIARHDFHVVGQTLVLRDAEGLTEFSLDEARREATPSDRVARTVFEPDAALTSPPLPLRGAAVAPPAARVPSAKRPAGADPIDPLGQATLDIDVIHALHVAGIHPPENAAVIAAEGGRVRADIAVADDTRRELLARALASLQADPRITINVVTRSLETPTAPPESAAPEPALPLIVRHFQQSASGRLDSAAIDRTARLFARWAVDQSAVRLRSLDALEYVADRQPLDMLTRLELEPLVKWQSMIRDHVREIARDTESLRAQVEPLVVAAAGHRAVPREALRPIHDLAEVPAAVKALVEAVRQQDAVVRRLFTAADAQESSPEDLLALARSFQKLEDLISSFAGPWWLGR